MPPVPGALPPPSEESLETTLQELAPALPGLTMVDIKKFLEKRGFKFGMYVLAAAIVTPPHAVPPGPANS